MIFGTRGSALALAQTNLVRALIHRAFPSLIIEIKIIKTSGDKQTRAPLAKSGIKGLFTKELEEALFRKKIDVGIHSLKDLPSELPAGLTLGAVTEREDPFDILIGHPQTSLQSPEAVYTSSPRRSIQAKLLWPSCATCDIRGNVETRLRKLADGKAGEAVLLAAAGLRRLNFLRGDAKDGTLEFEPRLPFRKLSVSEMIPAPGQGAIGIEARSEDGEILERLKSVNHAPTRDAVLAERAFLNTIGGGCAAPLAAYASISWEGLKLVAIVAENGKVWRGEKIGTRMQAQALGQSLAKEYLMNRDGQDV
jgi:hydroxymethylbilane synthase